MNLVLGTGQCTIGTMNWKTCFLHFDIVILGVEIAKIGKWKKKRSCARALIQTST